MTRGPCRTPPARRPTSRSTCLQTSSSGSGSSSVSIRRQALRNSGWSSTRPTGSVSYSDERCHHLYAVVAERRCRGGQMGGSVADVGPQAQVAEHQRASRQTSTETSVTGSANGGSGLAALTQIALASNWSSSRSAIAAHRRSSVL